MIEFFFDCSSPWTYLAFHNIQPMAAELGVAIAWRPVLVGGIFNTINPSVYASRENPVPAKAAYMRKDLADWARAAFEAYWGDDEDISQDDVLARVAARAGVEPASLFAGLGQQAVKDRLRANTEELMRRGGFGSPTMFAGGTDMFFGNDRLALVRAALERSRKRPAAE
jgi:2-hydroxychromene-2-carboxylate isomerase